MNISDITDAVIKTLDFAVTKARPVAFWVSSDVYELDVYIKAHNFIDIRCTEPEPVLSPCITIAQIDAHKNVPVQKVLELLMQALTDNFSDYSIAVDAKVIQAHRLVNIYDLYEIKQVRNFTWIKFPAENNAMAFN